MTERIIDFRKEARSENATVKRNVIKLMVREASKHDLVLALGVSSTRFTDMLPVDGIIHSICVVGALDNKTFNDLVNARDSVSTRDELPLMPFPCIDECEPYEIIWRRSLKSS